MKAKLLKRISSLEAVQSPIRCYFYIQKPKRQDCLESCSNTVFVDVNGNFEYYLNGKQHFPEERESEITAFIILLPHKN